MLRTWLHISNCHHYSKSQPLSVGIFFACSPIENRNDVASVAPVAAHFPARFPQIPLSVISRDASARDATSSVFNDLQAAGSISILVGRLGAEKGLARYARIHAGSCGLRRRPWRRYSTPFSLSVGQFSPFRRPVKPAKSSSTKYNTALNQWPACGLINGVRLTYWVAVGTKSATDKPFIAR